jgi:hypothetical protein
MPWSDISQVDRQDVGDQDFRGMTATGTIWLVFVGEVLAKCALGAGAILWSAARADFARSVSDDPHRPLSERAVGVSLLGAKPQASAFLWTRHSALISSIGRARCSFCPPRAQQRLRINLGECRLGLSAHRFAHCGARFLAHGCTRGAAVG